MTDLKKFKEANPLISKAIQALNRSHEFYERYTERYPSLTQFKLLMESEDPDFLDSLKSQEGVIQARLEFAESKRFFGLAKETVEPEDMMELFG